MVTSYNHTQMRDIAKRGGIVRWKRSGIEERITILPDGGMAALVRNGTHHRLRYSHRYYCEEVMGYTDPSKQLLDLRRLVHACVDKMTVKELSSLLLPAHIVASQKL